MQANQVITQQHGYFTKLFHQIRVSSHTLQFGSTSSPGFLSLERFVSVPIRQKVLGMRLEEQINETTGLFFTEQTKDIYFLVISYLIVQNHYLKHTYTLYIFPSKFSPPFGGLFSGNVSFSRTLRSCIYCA